MQEATPADLERDLTLEDFAADVSQIEVPEDRPIMDEDVMRTAEQFVATLQAR